MSGPSCTGPGPFRLGYGICVRPDLLAVATFLPSHEVSGRRVSESATNRSVRFLGGNQLLRAYLGMA